MMNQVERLLIISIAGIVSVGVTATVCYAALVALTLSEGGLQNLLFGGLIGTGAFGAGGLLTMITMRQSATGSATGSGGPTVNAENVERVTTAEPPEKP